MEYNFSEVEKKWQAYWAKEKTFRAENNSTKPKYYVLDMFPYPSGAGLHVGHPLGYIASDIYARYKRLKGFNVLHPMGYDSFGLPAEQYAIQTGQHPAITTETNIARYREQLDKIGFSFDWEREVRTSNPDYYKWTQWIFIKLFHSWYNTATNKAEPIENLVKQFDDQNKTFKIGAAEKKWNDLNEKEKSDVLMEYRLAYLSETYVNWCPQLGTVLANEEVKDGLSERGGYPVERKLMPQWSLRITAYADRLLNDLEGIDWTESIKEAQRNWIGKSEGTSLQFHLSPNPSPQERGANMVFEPMAGYFTTDGGNWNLLIDYVKQMRSNPTPAEKILWDALRAHRSGLKFRRQHIIDRFIVDFVCLSKMLVVEVDGDIHDLKPEEDKSRTAILNDLGFKVIRFRNEEVIGDTAGVVTKIIGESKKQNNYPEPESSIHILKEKEEEYSITKANLLSLEERGSRGEVIEVFTTRPDTVFGVTFVTLAPEHELIEKITLASYKDAVAKYIDYAKNRSERDRISEVKKITGQFTGAYVIHPFTNEKIPVWIGDYVLAGYGTGAVMGVPAHDSRDHAFATHFGLEIKKVVNPPSANLPSLEERGQRGEVQEAWEEKQGTLINSGFLDGLEVKAAIKKCIAEIENKNIGKGKTNYRLRDAIFGRQRYWGEPIPVYYKNGIPYTMEENDLPLVLPEVDKYLPTETGEPPLARAAANWKYKGQFDYETTTMPGWAGSSWYYLRYMDAHNDKALVSKEAVNYWKEVDLYIGGSEHATGHLLYVRFWTKFLNDLGVIPTNEPAKKLINQGMIQGVSMIGRVAKYSYNEISYTVLIPSNLLTPRDVRRLIIPYELVDFKNGSYHITKDKFLILKQNFSTFSDVEYPTYERLKELGGSHFTTDDFEVPSISVEDFVEKMSKSKWNVVTPDDIIEKNGADCLRMYEMFLGPLEQSKPWNTNGISGVSNFIRKLWKLYHSPDWNNTPLLRRGAGGEVISDEAPSKAELKTLHKTIKKVQEDIEKFSFNTSVSSFMICVNELTELKCNKRAILEPLAIILSSYAPHIAEELWSLLGHTETITYATFPQWKEEYLVEDEFEYPVSVNGKTRFKINLPLNIAKEEIEKQVLAAEDMQKWTNGSTPKKVIVVPGRIVNIVV